MLKTDARNLRSFPSFSPDTAVVASVVVSTVDS
jgi:hypothetical protein